MTLATFDDYRRLFGDDGVDAPTFDRLCFDACRLLCSATTGIDGVCRLAVCPPEDPDGREAVVRCACAVVRALYRIERCEQSAVEAAGGLTETAAGLRGSVIASVSAGNEFVSYRNPGADSSVYSRAVRDTDVRVRLLHSIVLEYLRGVRAGDGTSILYCG